MSIAWTRARAYPPLTRSAAQVRHPKHADAGGNGREGVERGELRLKKGPPMSLVPGIPAGIQEIIQDNTLEREFRDALFPELLFRSAARPELWEAERGDRMIFTRTGLLQPRVEPLPAGTDPTPATYGSEQWEAIAEQYGNTIDTHMPTSYVTMRSKFAENTKKLALDAGQTANRLVRNPLYRAYLGGNTVLTAAAGSGDTTVQVASISGFTHLVANSALVPVSSANPISVVIGTTAALVIDATPADPASPHGPGTLTLSAALGGAGEATRAAVLATNRSRITRVGGGNSVDAITAANILTLQDVINTVARLRAQNVPTMPDGTYHVHLSPIAEAQIYQDNQWQRLYDSLPDSMAYRDLAIGRKVGCTFFRNNEVPTPFNTGSLVATNNNAQASVQIGAEVYNSAGVPIDRTIVLGGGTIVEKYLDESRYITEAGATGVQRVGRFTVVNNGLAIMVDRIRFIIRSPLDRLGQVVSQTWSWSGDFPIPSDQSTGNPARYKRAAVIEHAGSDV